jgi:hypothetical protein
VIEYGQREAIRIATQYRQGEAATQWPGMLSGALTVGLPVYMQQEMDETEG